jgi:glycosyltransferase involved in cell wall biosynthesis
MVCGTKGDEGLSMRIVINASAVSSVKGGASFYIVNTTRALAKHAKQHEYIVVCTRLGKPIFSNIDGIAACIALAPKMVALRLAWEQLLLPFICRYYKADLLFSPNYTMPLLTLGYKNVVTIHDLSFFPLYKLYPRSRRFFKPIIHASVRRADGVIAVSQFTKNDIDRYIGAASNKTTIVYCAAHERYTATASSTTIDVRRHFGLSKPFILCSGFLEPRKNINRLIAAYGKICDRIPHDLVIVGGKGWWYENLPDAVKNAGLTERVRFIGYVPDDCMPALYREAALTAFVSLYEGFGLAAVESIACGTPVLVSDNTALPEVVGDAGLYANPYDIDDIAEKLLRMNDPALIQTLKNNCPAAARRFSWEKNIAETVAVFEKVAPDTRKPRNI